MLKLQPWSNRRPKNEGLPEDQGQEGAFPGGLLLCSHTGCTEERAELQRPKWEAPVW